MDQNYFGGIRKGRRDRGTTGKVSVFGILERGGKVHTKIIPDTRTAALLPITRQKVVPDSTVSLKSTFICFLKSANGGLITGHQNSKWYNSNYGLRYTIRHNIHTSSLFYYGIYRFY